MIKDLKPPSDLESFCEDLKCCGRRELSELLKLRYKYNVATDRVKKSEKDAKKALEPEKEITQEELEAMVDKELDETIKRVEREKKRALKKQRVEAAKQDVRKKMSVIAATSINNDEDLMLDQKTWDKIKSLEDAEDIQKYLPKNMPESEDDEQMDPNERKFRFYNDGALPVKEKNEGSDSSSDEDFNPVKKVDRMAGEIDDSIRQQRHYQMLRDKKTIKQEYKTKALVELQRQKKQDLSDDEALLNDDLMNKRVKTDDPEDSEYSENDDDLEEEREIIKMAKDQAKLKKQKRMEDGDDKEDEEEKQMFLNPLLAFKNNKKKERIDGKVNEDSDAWSDDDKYEPKETKEEKKAKKEKERKLLGKRKRSGIQGDIDDVNAFFKNEAIEEVPETDHSKLKKKGPDDLPDGYSSMDSDEIAETRALAKKMLRKKFRTETIDASYGRYAHEENDDIVPDWFLEDEAKHNRPNVNLTQDEIDEEKRQLREWNARPSKKVTEAKARKKMRLVKALTKIKQKS